MPLEQNPPTSLESGAAELHLSSPLKVNTTKKGLPTRKDTLMLVAPLHKSGAFCEALLRVTNFSWFSTEHPVVGKKLKS